MKILIDMNLSPAWVDEFRLNNIESVHWSSVGKFDAPDAEIVEWAKLNEHIILTHDLDFGTALAITKAESPSVIQIRTQDITVLHLKDLLIPHLKHFSELLIKGALLVIDEDKQRVRLLPLK